MSEFRAEKRVVVFPDADALASGIAEQFVRRARKRSATGKTSHVLLTGGTACTMVMRAVGAHPRRGEVDWSTIHFWWGDERFLPRDAAERNERTATEALLSHIDVPARNVHPVPASDAGLDLDGAVARYAEELASFGTVDQAWPVFHMCFLGVGADGHIASLFPDRTEIADTEHSVLPVRDAPLPPAEQVTVTRPVINSARRVWLALPGQDKASALGLALAGASYHSVPAAGAKGRKQTVFFVDEAAAGSVPEDLIDPEF